MEASSAFVTTRKSLAHDGSAMLTRRRSQSPWGWRCACTRSPMLHGDLHAIARLEACDLDFVSLRHYRLHEAPRDLLVVELLRRGGPERTSFFAGDLGRLRRHLPMLIPIFGAAAALGRSCRPSACAPFLRSCAPPPGFFSPPAFLSGAASCQSAIRHRLPYLRASTGRPGLADAVPAVLDADDDDGPAWACQCRSIDRP